MREIAFRLSLSNHTMAAVSEKKENNTALSTRFHAAMDTFQSDHFPQRNGGTGVHRIYFNDFKVS